MDILYTEQTGLVFQSLLQCSCSCTDHPRSRHTWRYTWHLLSAQCSYLQLLVVLDRFSLGMLSTPSAAVLVGTSLGIHIIITRIHLFYHLHMYWLTLLLVHLLTNLQLPISASKCAPRCILLALPAQWLPRVGVGIDSSTVITRLCIIAPQLVILYGFLKCGINWVVWLWRLLTSRRDVYWDCRNWGGIADTQSGMHSGLLLGKVAISNGWWDCHRFLGCTLCYSWHTIVAASPCTLAAPHFHYWQMDFIVL